jgi:hypothetical protein
MSGVLSRAQLTLLGAIQDRLVPPTADVPGAGALGGAERVDDYLVERPTLRPALLGILQAVEAEAALRMGSESAGDQPAFLDLSPEQRDGVLRVVEVSAPTEFRALVRQTYNAYYTHPVVQAAVGNTSPAPQPAGYLVERFDETRLDRVKAAGRRWRDV